MTKENKDYNVSHSYTIKPSLLAFTKAWLWLVLVSIQILLMDSASAQIILAMMYILPVALVLLLVTLGRSYTLGENIITKTNHIARTKTSIFIGDINGIILKPNMFGYGQVIFTLVSGRTFKMNNIKLPKHQEAIDTLLKNQTAGYLKTQGRYIYYQA